jgi:hypothetical protein
LAEPNHATNHGQKTRKLPITCHPLFPAIVALWFCALLGAGSFVVSISALEHFVLALHIDSIVPAAVPPLGATARLAAALLLGTLGGTIGWVFARRLGAPDATPPPAVFKVADLDVTLTWPGSATAEPEGFAALEIEPAGLPVIEVAPLPGVPAAAAEPARFTSLAVDPEPPVVIGAASLPIARRAAAAPSATQRLLATDLQAMSHVELAERLAIALQRRERLAQTAPSQVLPGDAVILFPGLSDRQGGRPIPPPTSEPAPTETEKALRDALIRLERIGGGA